MSVRSWLLRLRVFETYPNSERGEFASGADYFPTIVLEASGGAKWGMVIVPITKRGAGVKLLGRVPQKMRAEASQVLIRHGMLTNGPTFLPPSLCQYS